MSRILKSPAQASSHLSPLGHASTSCRTCHANAVNERNVLRHEVRAAGPSVLMSTPKGRAPSKRSASHGDARWRVGMDWKTVVMLSRSV
ncbi:hypothetical protein B0H12DRAFT_1159639 [Mycena haematopus]|nr:hypothetical protein B0H12DRAFT_1159639 [Mycena haematopus]